MVQKKQNNFITNIKLNFINCILKYGHKSLSEKIYKNIFKHLLKHYNKKNSKIFIQISISFFLTIFKYKTTKSLNNLFSILLNRIILSIKFIVDKFIYRKKFYLMFVKKNFSIQKSKFQIKKFNSKKLMFFYRW